MAHKVPRNSRRINQPTKTNIAMLNNTSYKIGGNTTEVSFNTPATGIIQKSHPKSRFINCHRGSKMADWLFDDVPQLKKKDKYDRYEKWVDITILQIMVFGDQLLVEIVHNEFLTD